MNRTAITAGLTKSFTAQRPPHAQLLAETAF